MSFHLLIIGGGSAAITAALRAVDRGCRVSLIHDGLPLGGSCLHVGCVPSKFMIRAAESHHHAHHSRFPGLTPKGADLNFAEIIHHQRRLVNELRQTNYEGVLPEVEGLTLYAGRGTLVGPRSVEVNNTRIDGDGVLLATGSRSSLPPIPGIEGTPVWSNENLFEQTHLPTSILVLGGGYIALEAAQMLARFGTEVTILQRSTHLLSSQPADLGTTLEEQLTEEGVTVHCTTHLDSVSYSGDHFLVKGTQEGKDTHWTAEKLFVGLGRAGITEGLGLEENGIHVRSDGFISTNEHLETSCPGVYAAGDVLGGRMFVYTAAHEAEIAVDNLLGAARTPDYHGMPWVVFTDPQIAGAGLSAEEALAAGYDVETAELPVARWPRFRVSRHSRGFLRLIRDRKTNTLLGARAIAPEAGDLMSEISLIIRHKIPLSEITDSLYPYLTLSEGIQRCAQRFS